MNWKLWGAPIALGISTAIGLLSALVGDGWWDVVSALALGAPVAVGLWYGWRRT
ncbi:hypothetical protein [Pseudoduganella guangdongensis]|uniref:hypothetical protein n=1 Tax=Pseudoduganella guangdongensis TaxID=2692179 RepID=UPI001928C88B|nr:hypothetical protein [Pseudoduganella guangdongensis]